MSEHRAVVRWRVEGDFKAGHYSRAHAWHFDGGAIVRASASPSIVALPYVDPAGVDPEEALVASVSACHMLWFLDLARADGFDIAAYEDDAAGSMGRDEDGRTAMLRITLRPGIVFAGDRPDAAAIAGLHDRAHERCFIANSLKTPVLVEAPDAFSRS